jgi:hypothetical protein
VFACYTGSGACVRAGVVSMPHRGARTAGFSLPCSIACKRNGARQRARKSSDRGERLGPSCTRDLEQMMGWQARPAGPLFGRKRTA